MLQLIEILSSHNTFSDTRIVSCGSFTIQLQDSNEVNSGVITVCESQSGISVN